MDVPDVHSKVYLLILPITIIAFNHSVLYLINMAEILLCTAILPYDVSNSIFKLIQ